VKRILAVGVIIDCILATTSCYQSPEVDYEPARLLLSGPCAAGTDRLVEVQTLRTNPGSTPLRILGLDGTGLPADGYFTRYPSHIRDAAWFLAGYSCPDNVPACGAPAQFRLCTARRIDWQIAISCIDGLDRPVCTGLLREAPPP
jgi:hypothetical protein